MARKKLYINNTDLSTYGIYITSDTVLNAPSFDYVEHQVPGRDGTLLQYNNRLNNVVRKFACCIPSRLLVNSGIASLKKLLYANPGYVKIASDYESGVYQYGYLAQDINVKPFNVYRMCTFDLYFSCQPKKYFNSANVSISGAYFNDMRCVLTRSNGFIKKLFDELPLPYIPEDQAFFVIGKRANSISSGTSLTGISCSWSEGDNFCAVAVGKNYPRNETDFLELVAYSNESISSVSYTTTQTGYLWFIVPVETKGTYTAAYNSTTITTPSLASATVSLNNASATGALIKADMGYYFDNGFSPGTFYPNALVFRYYSNNAEMGDVVVVWRNDLVDANMYSILQGYSDYYDSTYNFSVSIDLEKNTVIVSKTGKPNLVFDGYMEIDGAIPQVGIDKVEAITFKSGSSSTGKMYADWWAL